MNKRTIETSQALTGMDDALVSEAVRAAKPRKNRAALIAAAAAAVLVLVFAAAAVLPKLLTPGKSGVTAQLPDNTAEPAPTDEQHADVVNETSSPAPATQAPVETPSSGPQYTKCTTFNSVHAVAMAVSTNKQTNENAVLSGLTGIYMPTKVPYGAGLAGIEITADTVLINYSISEEYAHGHEAWEPDPDRFELTWYRNHPSGSAAALAEELRSMCYLGTVTVKNGAHIIRSDGYTITAVWEQDGCVFALVVPGYYCEDEEVLSFTGLVRVDVDDVNAHSPAEGFVKDGYMWLAENEFGFSPVSTFAYGTTYVPETGGMLAADGLGFLNGVTDPLTEFPCVGCFFEPVLLEDTTIGSITVYNAVTLEPIAENISLEELRDIAELNVSDEFLESITVPHYGFYVLVDMIVVHRGNYIETLNEYETDAYHCGFVLACGH